MCIALVRNAGDVELEWREAVMQAGFGLWVVREGQVSVASRIEGLEALVIMTDGVSDREKDAALRIAHERGVPAWCVNCEGAVLCRTVPGMRDDMLGVGKPMGNLWD